MTASGQGNGAGIGGANNAGVGDAGRTITISGGTVTANGNTDTRGTGIGGSGSVGVGETLIIDGHADVTVIGGIVGGTGFGGGYASSANGSPATLTIATIVIVRALPQN